MPNITVKPALFSNPIQFSTKWTLKTNIVQNCHIYTSSTEKTAAIKISLLGVIIQKVFERAQSILLETS